MLDDTECFLTHKLKRIGGCAALPLPNEAGNFTGKTTMK